MVESDTATEADVAGLAPGEPGVDIDDLGDDAADGVIAIGRPTRATDDLDPADELDPADPADEFDPTDIDADPAEDDE